MAENASDKPSIVEALAAVMGDVRAVRKNDRNTTPGQNYMFRGVDAVMNAAGPALRKHGVIVVPMVEDVSYRDVQTSTGKPSRECTVKVRYRFHGPAGDHIDCVTPGESMDFGDKGAPKAMSVAFRIALLQALCLPTDDPEPDAHSYERGAPSHPQATRNGAQGRPYGQQQHDDAPASTDTATTARAALGAHCKRMKYDASLVAQRYSEQYGEALGSATDPVRIRAFTKLLDGMPSASLGVPEPAGAQP